jgi:hypothetical protein
MNPLRALGPRWDAIAMAAVIALLLIVFALSAGAVAFAMAGVVLLLMVLLAGVMRIAVYDAPPPSLPLAYGLGWLAAPLVVFALYDAFGATGIVASIVLGALYGVAARAVWTRMK